MSHGWMMLLLGMVAMASLPVPMHAETPQIQPHAWERWEQALHSSTRYADPVRDVTLRVVFEGPGGRALQGYGFWDGGDTFRVRCAFSVPGTWRWRTNCSDTANRGLDGQSGELRVRPYTGRNPLYRHGFLRVSENGRYLCHADGTPFLWIGDTAWAAPFRATPSDWATYLANRVRKRFTVTQVALAPSWAGERDSAGNRPFLGEGLNAPNPAFWQAYEQKIDAANRAGLAVMLVGVMEPTVRYPTQEEARRFARYLVARLYGNHVLFSPSFDSGYMPLGDTVGEALREATSAHLITQHPGTPSGRATNVIADAYRDKPYLDFAGDQSGHNGGDRERCARQAIEWNLSLWRRMPPKPVVNLEAMYDAHGADAWTADDARSLGWRSWLSGAKGYTYGAGDTGPKVPGMNGGVWFWVTDPSKPDEWRKAIEWPSADQMTVLHDFLAGIAWWKLEPASELVADNPGPAAKRICLAATPERDLAVAYVPAGDGVTVDLSAFRGPLMARWIDPVTGRTRATVDGIAADRRRIAAPSAGEWVLLLRSPRRDGIGNRRRWVLWCGLEPLCSPDARLPCESVTHVTQTGISVYVHLGVAPSPSSRAKRPERRRSGGRAVEGSVPWKTRQQMTADPSTAFRSLVPRGPHSARDDGRAASHAWKRVQLSACVT